MESTKWICLLHHAIFLLGVRNCFQLLHIFGGGTVLYFIPELVECPADLGTSDVRVDLRLSRFDDLAGKRSQRRGCTYTHREYGQASRDIYRDRTGG